MYIEPMPNTQEQMAVRTARLLWQAGCVTVRSRPSFRWASGLLSPLYTDNRLLLADPKKRDAIARALIGLLQKKRIPFEVIAGVATSGIPLASILADRLKKPLVYVRPSPKGHGRGRQLEGRLARGARTLLIEDLVSTGSSSLSALRTLRRHGARTTHILTILTYLPAEVERRFRKAGLLYLTDADHLLSVGLRDRFISPRQEEGTRRFLARLAQQLRA